MGDQASEYDEWRATHHATMPATDVVVLTAAVRAATGGDAVHWERIARGEVNEVHAATLVSGDQVIVRVSRKPGRAFESERWALTAARELGLPVPAMLHIDHLDDSNGPFSICVEDRLPGIALEDVTDPAEQRRLAADAGELAARLHSVRVTGFGFVRPDGTAPASSWRRVMGADHPEEQHAATAAAGAAFDIPGAWVRAAGDELRRHDELFARVEPQLTHGDLSVAHVLTDGGRVTGLIDFEQALGGDPAYDFAQWGYYRDQLPLEWLLVGYRRIADPGEDLELRIRLVRLRLHLALIDIYTQARHPLAGRIVRQRFAEDAAWFGFAMP